MDLACSSESYTKEIDAGQLALVDWFRLCAEELGLRAVELEDKHIGAPTPEHLAELRAAADRHGLEIVNIAFMNAFGEAELLGVQLVMENHNHRGFVQTGSDVLAIMEAVGSPALGLLLDTGNYLDGLASIERTARLAWHVHAKFTQVLEDGRDARVDQDAAVAVLRTVGYKGYVSVEYEGAEPSMTAVPRALAYLRGLVHK